MFDINIHDAKIQNLISHSKQRVDSIYSHYATQYFNTQMEMRHERLKNLSENNLTIEDLLQEKDEFLKEYQEKQKALNNYNNSLNERLINDSNLIYYEYEQKKYRIFAETCMLFGVFLIAWGFSSWYFKHQIYVDAEIKWKGQRFRELLKNADNISKSKSKQTDLNDEIPYDESIS